ncbi:MAG: hypothetical protein A2583_13650 [Bdellovibrionales bacterium RIFOXYD1_FULL_53_11]|nr:MAG: hypothetical protein A2583_13650 [Bdellovibrionales bacterium RIFOXYD1_FULL_53_11]
MSAETNQTKNFREFLAAEEVQPPRVISETILGKVRADLNPSFYRVFWKVLIIHAFAGSVSLLFCPQFGISPLNTHGLLAFYMRLGEYGCLAACGATFIAGSALIASLILRPEEVRALRRTRFFQIASIGFCSLGVFAIFGDAVALTLWIAWFTGLFFSGVASLEVGYLVRSWQWK